ncbi:MAG: putative toxin-antitoxin system toxin component, PIN family [Crocosphaera sp.]
MKVVLDVNIWVSALLWGGLPIKILSLARQNKLTIFISESILTELEMTLKREKFKKQLEKRKYTVNDLILITEDLTIKCAIFPLEVPQLRDSKDSHILATAVSANAEVLITGDLDLLVLETFSGIVILNPSDFLNDYGFFT